MALGHPPQRDAGFSQTTRRALRVVFGSAVFGCLALGAAGCAPDEPAPSLLDDSPAEDLLPTASGLFPRSTPAQREALEIARVAFAAGDTPRAMRQLDELARSTPASEARARAVVLLSELEARAGRLDDADARLDALEQDSPPFAPIYYALAQNALRAGENDRARAELERTIHADRTVLRAYIVLAALQDEAGDEAAASETLLRMERAMYRLGERFRSSSDANEKVRIVRALGDLPPNATASRLLAIALTSDATDVQLAALDGLEALGTENAIDALEALATTAPQDAIRARAVEAAAAIRRR